jgi:hypothetical protein
MRVHAILMIAALSLPSTVSGAQSENHSVARSGTPSDCPGAATYLAEKLKAFRGQPLKPRKLTELPPAIAYMAVERHIGHCEAPLTMADYRRARR